MSKEINNKAQSLMASRLGISNAFSANNGTSIDGIGDMEQRLQFHGGNPQQERMIKDKRRSLDHAVLYSYQGALVRNLGDKTLKRVRALINPDKVKQNYDDKIISIGYEYGYQPGDVFEWCNTNSYWLVYLQDMTELAYFRGEIRKCNYQISWEDENDNVYSTYAAVRGPVETKINFIQKGGTSYDLPNHSLNILMPANKETLKYFNRYAKFYLNQAPSLEKSVCWRVEARDAVSMPGVLKINAVEYYTNEHEDDIENGVAGGLISKPIDPNKDNPKVEILGPVFIKPKQVVEYEYIGQENAKWSVEGKYPIKAKIDGNRIRLVWTATYSGQFILKYGNEEKTIVVESLF